MTIRVLGVDSSLTGTGLCRTTVMPDSTLPDDGTAFDRRHELATVGAPKPRPGAGLLNKSMRVSTVIDTIEAVILEEKLDLIALEELAYGAKGANVYVLPWIWGRIVDLAVRHHVRLVLVNTSVVKKFATGNGGAKKDVVMLSMANRFPDAGIADNNQADAMACALVGCRYLGYPVDTMPKLHLEFMDKVKEQT